MTLLIDFLGLILEMTFLMNDFHNLKALQEAWILNFNTDEDNNHVKWREITVTKLKRIVL